MKMMLLLISFAFLSVSSDPTVEESLTTNDGIAVEAINIDFYTNVIGDIYEHETGSEECPCCNCSLHTAICDCGSWEFQWCDCPWFPPNPWEMAIQICTSKCG